MKVVINSCFGGFSVSLEALMELIHRDAKCVAVSEWTEKDEETVIMSGWEKIDIGDGWFTTYTKNFVVKDGLCYYVRGNDCETRTDETLIAVVEELGDRARGTCAHLTIVEIPDGIKWHVEEYDGNEHVTEDHGTWY